MRTQEYLADLTYAVATIGALLVGAISLFSGSPWEAVVSRAVVALVGLGICGWMLTKAANPAWYRMPAHRPEVDHMHVPDHSDLEAAA